ncbi:hypothetical protein [Streptosporangium lutulentum]|uniref:Uncharacterized protein n=1 Tax=Streptosporangium lutulentum TaxID=1461250 RepID=A0ABT9Q9I1_9ACTN|nr:hypothetical protein [Streptosporangium lutulentum]MDP9843322.1 hypothetical protein [Streptosporangium lutulentum]
MTEPKKPNPGRLPPAEQRAAAEKAFEEAARAYYEAITEPTRVFHEALVAASGPPEGVPGSDQKSLVTRRQMVKITQGADPAGEGLTLHAVCKLIDETLAKQAQ